MRLLLVAHAAPQWGFGHLNRCLVLANLAEQRGWSTVLMMRGPVATVKSRLGGYKGSVCFINETASLEAELFKLEQQIKIADRIIIDHPNLNKTYAHKLDECSVPWLTFNYRMQVPGTPDWLVNIRPGLKPIFKEGKTRYLLGPAYAVLRAEFHQSCAQPYRPLAKNPRLFVTFGGGDDFGASAAMLPVLLKTFPRLTLDVVTTPANAGLEVIDTLAQQYAGRLCLHVQPDNIQSLMCRAGAALTAAGTTTYELARCGIPFMMVTLVENQKAQAVAWDQINAGRLLGDIKDPDLSERLIARLQQWLSDTTENCLLHQTAVSLVDGYGAGRVLDALKAG